MFGATFNLVTRVKTTVIVRTLKDDSLYVSRLASNYCFSHSNVFQNGVNTFSKMVDHFLSKKLIILYCLDHRILFKFHQHVVQMLIKYCMERLLSKRHKRLKTSNVSISNGNLKFPIRKSIFPVNLPLKLFRATVANADIKSLKSFHTFL